MIAGVPVLLRPEWEKLVPSDDPEQVMPIPDGLPQAARRWISASVDPNTPHWQSVQLVTRGELRYGDWHEFLAREIVNVDKGFIWAGLSTKGVPMRVVDQYTEGVGNLRLRLAGVVPIRWQDPEQLSESAAGRFALESLLLPTGWDRWTFTESSTENEFTVTIPVGDRSFEITVTTDEDGHLLTASMLRFGWPEEKGPGVEAPFGVRAESWSRWNGILIPEKYTASWWFGSAGERELLRASVSLATFA